MGNKNSGRRPGRPPLPLALKILRGNPGKRPLPEHEPTIAVAGPSFDVPPPELGDDPAASAEWLRVAPILRAAGLVSEAERAGLTALCQQWSRYIAAHAHVIAHGMCIETVKGIPVPNPYLKIADAALNQCARLWSEFGLTPAGRARARKLPAADDVKPSKWAGLL